MRKFINFLNRKVSSLLGTYKINLIEGKVSRIQEIVENVHIHEFLKENLFTNPKYTDSKRITHFHSSVFTQNGEDGILEEIFRRLGVTNKIFVEFGVHGVKNNSTFLLLKDWKGFWIGATNGAEDFINKKFRQQIENNQLLFKRSWITKENIELLFKELQVPKEFDYLSIDLDGNDFWIWNAICYYKPRVLSIEYNATFPPNISWVMDYDENHKWDQSNYFGASLKALETLAHSKGYILVGCDFTGCNAFFIREDQDLELFQKPFTAEFHYEPPRYFLEKSSGHNQSFGPFQNFK